MPAAADCQLCGEEPAVMSQMNLADYTTVMVGASCLLPFYQAMVHQLSPEAADTGALPVPDATPAAGPAAAEPGPDDDPRAAGRASRAPSQPRKTRGQA